MKKITKLLALLLTLALLISLAACGGSGSSKRSSKKDDADDEEETASIAGTWRYTVQFNDLLEAKNADLGDAGLVELYSKLFDGFSVTLVMNLEDDNTYSASFDEEALKDTLAKLEERLPEIMPDVLDYVLEMQGITMDQFEAALTAQGMTMDDALEMVAKQFDVSELFESITKDANAKGTYTYEDGKLVLTKDNGNQITYTVELSSKKLKVTELEGTSDTFPEELLPLTFVREK